MNKVSKLGMLFNEGNVPDFGSIQMKSNNTNIYYLSAQDIPKLNGMLTKEAAASYLTENETLDICSGALAFVVDHQTANSGKIYVYHREQDHWYESNIRSDLGLWDFMWNRHARILRETKEINGTPPLTFKSNGRPLKNYCIYGNTVNGESVGDPVAEGEHAGEYLVPITVRGKNLFNSASNWNLPGSFSTDGSKFPGSILGNRRTFFVDVQPNTTYTLSFISCGDRVGIAEYGRVINPENYSVENKLTPDRIITPSTAVQSGESYSISFTTASNAKMVGIYYSLDVLPSGIQIEIGNTATEYEPYHKPIKVNLYITEPLVTGDSVSFKEIGTAIPTISGTNIITVETTVQPPMIELTGKLTNLNL